MPESEYLSVRFTLVTLREIGGCRMKNYPDVRILPP